MGRIKIGLIGLGYFGNFHLNNLLKTEFEFVGFYDSDHKKAQQLASKHGIKNYNNLIDLIEDVDAIDITTPTKFHFDIIKMALSNNKHIFVEKPLVSTSNESEEILRLIGNRDIVFQVGHIERYNPAFDQDFFKNHKIIKIEANRYSTYNPRGTDVSVIFDLMIHDIDLILAFLKTDISSIKATSITKFGKNAEYASATIAFENKAIVTLNSSILHPYTERLMKIWTDKGYFEIDLGKKTFHKYFYAANPYDHNQIFDLIEKEEKEQNNQILDELNDFYHSIVTNSKPIVGLTQGHNAILLAEQILNQC